MHVDWLVLDALMYVLLLLQGNRELLVHGAAHRLQERFRVNVEVVLLKNLTKIKTTLQEIRITTRISDLVKEIEKKTQNC